MTSGTVRFKGLRVASLSSLRRALEERGGAANWVLTDLGLGAWRSHAAASEIIAQLGDAAGEIKTPRVFAPSGTHIPYADIVGAGIDGESAGDRTALQARSLADTIKAALAAEPVVTIGVLVPRFGNSWVDDDTLLLEALARESSVAGRVWIIGTDEEPLLPAYWGICWEAEAAMPASSTLSTHLGTLVPGLLAPGVARILCEAGELDWAHTLPLRQGFYLTAPEQRRPSSSVPRLSYDRLGVLLNSTPDIEAYSQVLGNNLYVNASFLCEQAWLHFTEGGGELGLRLIERAATGAKSTVECASVTMQAQGMRIALGRFGEVAMQPDPSPALPPSLRGFLLQAKGWGLVMEGEPQRALSYLKNARELLGPASDDRAMLYLLNILALAHLRSGDWEAAMNLECCIERKAKELPTHDSRLEYVNAINLGRLHRLKENWDSALVAYRRAFDTLRGLRSEGDAIHENVCSARIEGERGSADRALAAWVRAALHFVAARIPEAVSRRVYMAILGRQPRGRGGILVEEGAEAFGLHLAKALRAVKGGSFDLADGEAPVFFSVQDCAGQFDCAVGGDGWSVLASPTVPDSPQNGLYHRRLRSWLSAFISAASEIRSSAWGVDDRGGIEIAGTPIELVETCVLTGTRTIVNGGSTATLDSGTLLQLALAAHVEPGPGVLEIVTTIRPEVRFRRCHSPRHLAGDEAQLLADIGSGTTVRELCLRVAQDRDPTETIDRLRNLTRARIIRLLVREDTCSAAGIRWRSSATSATALSASSANARS